MKTLGTHSTHNTEDYSQNKTDKLPILMMFQGEGTLELMWLLQSYAQNYGIY